MRVNLRPTRNEMSRNECSRLNAGCLSSKSQEYVPTGIASLDSILSNGYPLGGLILLEEDEFQVYSETFLKYFLAEGIANDDYIFLASKDTSPLALLREVPSPVKHKEEVSEVPFDELKIAWRYQNNAAVKSSPTSHKISFSHEFDFNSKINKDILSSNTIHLWPKDHSAMSRESFLNEICVVMSSKNLWSGQESQNPSRKILRVCVSSMGSPFWGDENIPVFETLLKLRTVIHNSSSVALVSIPSLLLDKLTLNRCEQVSDIVISLKSLANNRNKQYNEYSGLLTLLKISPVNSLSIHVPDDSDWGFKLKKKKLIIEKLHLPPESSLTEQREQDEFLSSRPSCQVQF